MIHYPFYFIGFVPDLTDDATDALLLIDVHLPP